MRSLRGALEVLTHASEELLSSFLVRTEDDSLVLFLWLAVLVQLLHPELLVVPGQRADLVAEDLALFGELAALKLLE